MAVIRLAWQISWHSLLRHLGHPGGKCGLDQWRHNPVDDEPIRAKGRIENAQHQDRRARTEAPGTSEMLILLGTVKGLLGTAKARGQTPSADMSFLWTKKHDQPTGNVADWERCTERIENEVF